MENNPRFKKMQMETQIKCFFYACMRYLEVKNPFSDSLIYFDKEINFTEWGLISFDITMRVAYEDEKLEDLIWAIRKQAIDYLKNAVENGRLFCRFERFDCWDYLQDAPLETLGRLVAMLTDADTPPVYGFSTRSEYNLVD